MDDFNELYDIYVDVRVSAADSAALEMLEGQKPGHGDHIVLVRQVLLRLCKLVLVFAFSDLKVLLNKFAIILKRVVDLLEASINSPRSRVKKADLAAAL